MVPDPDTACVGLEYFAFKGDELWTMERRRARRARHGASSSQLGLARPEQVRRGYVVRVPLAYPMYDEDYAERVETIRALAGPARHGLPAGRPQRAAPLQQLRPLDAAAPCAPWTTSSRGAGHDIWAVNVESAYHEEETDAQAQQPYKNGAGAPRR